MSASPKRIRIDSPTDLQRPVKISTTEKQYVSYQTTLGNTYDGECVYYNKTYIKHGMGHENYNDGSQYEGEWENGKMHGKGMYIDNNGDLYQGYFHQGKKWGKGRMTYKNGNSYEG